MIYNCGVLQKFCGLQQLTPSCWYAGWVGSVVRLVILGECMSCRSCGSEKQGSFESEITIYLPGLDNVQKLPALAFPIPLICLDCGFLETRLSDSELKETIEASGGTEAASE